jgi:hypothetical protein
MTSRTISRADERMEVFLARHTREPLTSIRTTDGKGNKLRDVVDPRTGFCVGVTSPTWTDGQRVIEPTGVSGNCKPEDKLTLDKATGLWYYGEHRVVVRTTDTPEGPMRTVRIAKAPASDRTGRAEKRSEAKSKIKRAPKSPSSGSSGSSTRVTYTRAEVAEYLRVKYGYTGNISNHVLRSARTAMEHDRQITDYTGR